SSTTYFYINLFFFSSRRRHTRWPRDWSSDVCSSDLSRRSARSAPACARRASSSRRSRPSASTGSTARCATPSATRCASPSRPTRSEERRVGKELIEGGGSEHEKKEVERISGQQS